jgi:hypothetical protein
MTGMRERECTAAMSTRQLRTHLRRSHAGQVAGHDLRDMSFPELIRLHHRARDADRAAAMTRPVSKREMADWIRKQEEAAGAGNCWCSPTCSCTACRRGDCMNCKERARW